MATYKEIKGVTVQTRDEDPSLFVGSWAAGGDLNNSGQGRAAGGTQTSNIVFGGPSPHVYVEEYDGTSWTETTELNTGRVYGFGCGTNAESAMASGGYTNPSGPWFTQTETWNGSAWTEVNEMNTARGDGGMFGVVPGSIAAGGYSGSINPAVESWNGSSWSEVAELNTDRYYAAGVGHTGTAGLVVGGSTPSATGANELWNGSSWTELADLNTARNRPGGSGTSTAGLAFGGAPHPKANTESWDGSSWTEVNDLATARYGVAGSPSGTSQLALASGGYSTTNLANTEEWSFPLSPILTEGDVFLSGGTTLKGFGKAAGIPAGTWASGGSLNTARTIGGGFGLTIPTAVCAGGYNPGGWKALTEEYNGSAFTEVNDMPQATDDMGSGGSLTAGIIFGGDTPPGNTPTNIALGYDGTNWTTLSSLNTARRSIGGAGVQTSALAFGGQEPGSASAKTESWDGSSWTETSDLNTARMGVQGAGHSNTAAIGAGGGLSPVINNVEQWDGSSWTEKNNLNTARSFFAAGGVSTNALFYGGYVGTPSYTGKTEFWNGTSMTELNDLSTGRGSSGALPAGGAISQIATGGNPQPTASSETFEAEATLSTVTVS